MRPQGAARPRRLEYPPARLQRRGEGAGHVSQTGSRQAGFMGKLPAQSTPTVTLTPASETAVGRVRLETKKTQTSRELEPNFRRVSGPRRAAQWLPRPVESAWVF